MLRRERKRRREAETAYRDAGRDELAADRGLRGLDRSRPTCPPSCPTTSSTRWCAAAIAETGAESPRDMGKAIKHVMSAAGGRADGKRVSGKVKEALVN